MTQTPTDFFACLKAFHDLPTDPQLALLFPGQGAQKPGMGLEAFGSSATAKSIFETADQVIGTSLSRLCFEGPEQELTRTVNAQPALLTASLAVLAAALGSGIFEKKPAFMAGHSLGDYSALVAAGSLPFADALRLVRERGRLMEEAGIANPGTMAAIVGLTEESVAEVCRLSGAEQCNFNASTQIVIGGKPEVVEAASRLARQQGGRGLPMKVAGAFHTSLMETAARSFEAALDCVEPNKPAIPVIGNVSAKPLETSPEILSELRRQISRPVLWYPSILSMIDAGVRTFVEVGPGQTLITMLKRDHPDLTLTSLEQAAIPAPSHV